MSIIDKYPERLFFRVTKEDRDYLFDLAADNDTNVSTYVRSIIERELRKERRKNENCN